MRYNKDNIDHTSAGNWGFADATLECYWDEILSHNKSRRFGFHGWDESESRFLSLLKQYQESLIIPV
jgi:hypothetical protein